MKKRPQLNKKTIKHLKLKMKQISERKVAPYIDLIVRDRTNTMSCTTY
jgi:uncharacterized protein YneF (UPF0154 family)